MNMMNNNNINFMNNNNMNMNMMNNNIINFINNNKICIKFQIDNVDDIQFKDFSIYCSFNESLSDLFNKFWRFFKIDSEKRKKILFFLEKIIRKY